MLYEEKIEQVLIKKDSEGDKEETEQLKATTVFLPQILRLGLAELKEKKGAKIGIQKVTKAVIEHGHSIIQKKHFEAIKEIAHHISDKDFHVTAIRSTVLPGTIDRKIIPMMEQISGLKCGKDFGVCYNPEFLALGNAINGSPYLLFFLLKLYGAILVSLFLFP